MNYEQMSDFEVNRAVAMVLEPDAEVPCFDDRIPHDTDSAVQIIYRVGIHGEFKDYCNKPADAWPIIEDMRIAVMPSVGDTWVAECETGTQDQTTGVYEFVDKNPLRAAMIVYLMMQE